MAKTIHYEVFSRQGARGGWTMTDVRNDRQAAIELAKGLMAGERATGVKVVKETYNADTGDYLSLKIFEDGHNKMKVAAAKEDPSPAIPCFKPEDLYSYHARATITRLIPDFLARNCVTVSELGVRADLLEQLEATGTLLQHAIQKVAVAQASSTKTPVQQIIKALHELLTKTFNRVYRDERSKVFPEVEPGGFGPLATKLADASDAAYLLNGAIARYLKDAEGWDDKVFRLLKLTEEVPADGPGALLLLGAVDAMIAEVLAGSAALHDLIGAKENLGQALMALVQLFLGHAQPDAGERAGLIALTQHFADDDMPESRTAIASRIMAELNSTKRLCPGSLEDELRTLRQIANRVVFGVGKFLSHEDLVAAFTQRSQRLVNYDTLGRYLETAGTPDERVERLLFVEDNVIGAENKRRLASFIVPMVSGATFETHFLNSKTPPLARLQRLAQLQTRVHRSSFQDTERREICDRLDKIASQVEARVRLFDSIEARPGGAVEKATTILKLCTGGLLTEGALSAKARALVVGYLGQPGFMAGYIAQTAVAGARPSTDAAMASLMETLDKAGIAPETGLRAVAV